MCQITSYYCKGLVLLLKHVLTVYSLMIKFIVLLKMTRLVVLHGHFILLPSLFSELSGVLKCKIKAARSQV
jgi:hypothetical protein